MLVHDSEVTVTDDSENHAAFAKPLDLTDAGEDEGANLRVFTKICILWATLRDC